MRTEPRRARLADLKLLEVNARYMRHEVAEQLRENISRDGAMVQIPFVWIDPDSGEQVVLAGNNRVRRALEAGVEEDWVLVTDEPLTPDQRRAIQLSTNSLVG